MKKYLKRMIVVLLMITLLSGCKTGKPVVGVTVYPVQYLVQRIAGNKVDVEMLSSGSVIQRANIVGDYKSKLKKIDVLFHINQLESYYNVFRKEIDDANVEVIDLSITAAIYSFRRYTIANVAGSEITVESDYYSGNAFAAIDLYDKDPMLWMDPIAMTSMGKTVLNWLLKVYPEEAKTFNANFKTLQSELARLDAEYQQLRLNKKNVSFVSMTPSFGNWQKAYGVHVYPVFLSRFGVYPSDNQLQLIRKRIVTDKVKYIALEANLPEDMLSVYTSMLTDLGLKAVPLHNLAFLTEADLAGNKDYLTLMYENLNTLESISE